MKEIKKIQSGRDKVYFAQQYPWVYSETKEKTEVKRFKKKEKQ